MISLSFKNGDRLDPKNWWPISLLNVDYKIASRAIASRLLKVLHAVVDQMWRPWSVHWGERRLSA